MAMNDELHRERSGSDPVGLVYTGRSTVAVDSFGKRRPVSQLNKWEWIFLAVSVVNIAVSVALSVYRLVEVIGNEQNSPDFFYCILLIANSVFCLVYIFNGLLKEIEYEIYMFICAVIFIIVYCIVDYTVNQGKRNDIKLIRLIFCCVLGPVNILLAILVAREFGWLEFRIIGASPLMQRMYHQTALFASWLKFDAQASVSFVILAVQHGLELTTQNIISLSCGIPICIIWALLGFSAMRQESKWMSVLFVALGFLSPAYVVYCIVELFRNLQTQWLVEHRSIVCSQFVVGGLTFVVRVIVFFEFFYVYRNFGKGLKQHAFNNGADERTGLLARDA